MVQLTLPRGSKPTKGKHVAAPEGAKRTKRFRIYRWDPETGGTSDGRPGSSPWCS